MPKIDLTRKARPIIKMDMDGNLIAEYPTIKAASKEFGGAIKTYQAIKTACSLKRGDGSNVLKNIAYGFKWKFKEV